MDYVQLKKVGMSYLQVYRVGNDHEESHHVYEDDILGGSGETPPPGRVEDGLIPGNTKTIQEKVQTVTLQHSSNGFGAMFIVAA